MGSHLIEPLCLTSAVLATVHLSLSEMECHSDGKSDREAGCAVHACNSARRLPLNTRNEIVLRLPVAFVIQVVDREIEVPAALNPLRHA